LRVFSFPKYPSLVAAVLSLVIATTADANAQGQAALPFLLISPAPDGNSWGNMSTAVASDNAITMAASPGQLGMFSLGNNFSASTYTNKTAWLPAFQVADLTYNAWALAAGYNLSNDLSLPFPVGLGIGYSRIDLDLGTFIRTGSGGPEPIGTFHAYEEAKSVTVGVGVEYLLRLGMGWAFKDAHSVLGPVSVTDSTEFEAQVSMTDFGLLVQAPVVDIIESVRGDTIRAFDNIKPQVLLTFGYTISNRGDSVEYLAAGQPDPLPRNVTAGLSLELGFTRKIARHDWKILTFTLAREAEDILITRSNDGSFEYQSGWGDLSFFKNVIGGTAADCVNLHRGWQLNVCEFVYLRGGSYAEAKECGGRNYSTSGFALRLSGLFRLVEQIAPDAIGDGVVSFVADHIDIVYDHAEYSNHQFLGGTSFNALSIVVR